MWKKLDVIIIAVLGPERNEFEGEMQKTFKFKPFQATGVFLYPFWKQENPWVFLCFQGVWEKNIGLMKGYQGKHWFSKYAQS